MFFDNSILYSYLYRIREKGIQVPVIAGIMPVTNAKQIRRITQMSGTYLPSRFMSIVDRFGDNPAAMKQAGIAYATDQIIDLIANGVNGIHVYSMNKPDVAMKIKDAMIRKIHLAHCLKEGNWEAVRKDMNLRPVEGINGDSPKEEILAILSKYGISETEVTLWGTGTPLREFLWSEEMADASVFVMEHVDFKDTYKEGSKDIRNCHINIGTGKEITIRQLAERIVETVGYQGKLTFDSSKPDGTMRKLTDPSKLHALGWHHKIEIEEGVRKMYEWYLK